ncbi:hypothetical protein [Methylobacterium sp. 22177]|uniref:hypothetical protein n=1 Tax=Methylobacterium sp. 22177 TaxID=3453885 RepID=UPI003F850E56
MPFGFTPIFRIEQEGIDISDRFNDRLIAIDVRHSAGGGDSDTVEITLDDRDWKIAKPTVGRKLEIYLGYKEVGLAQQNVYEIKRVEFSGPPRSIKITGTSVEMIGGLKEPKVREFEGKTLGEIVEALAASGGVKALVEQGLGEKLVPFLNQAGQSSLHVLQELERRYGAISKFENGRLIFIPRDKNETVSGFTLPTLLLRPEHLAKWSVWHDKRGDFSSARAAYVDPNTHQPVWIEEENPRPVTDEEGNVARFPYRFAQPFQTEVEARAAVSGMIHRLNRSLGEINVTLSKGDPWIRGNQLTLIGGMREGINGSYTTEVVEHSYRKDRGLLTTILGKPTGGPDPYPNGADTDAQVLMAPQVGQTLGRKLDDDKAYGPLATRGATAPTSPSTPPPSTPDPNLP